MRKVNYNIILEGCDCVGKTTIANTLMQMRDFQKIKVSAPKDFEDGRQQYEALVACMNSERSLIFDRSMFGERVYGPIYRGYYPHYLDRLEPSIEPHNFLFLVKADAPEVIERFDGKFIKASDIGRILSSFEWEFGRCGWRSRFIVDTTKDTQLETAHKIIKICEGCGYA